ncbi:MAG: MotA/TolQ/ExbB proton channel family protein, partial [Flavobacteriaceae bacterium]|nr:MotA/TolQ/ExbB proton channel family protein [Flavobacteriaceae bacterium]
MLLFLQENVDTLTDVVSEEKTLSIYKLIMESGTGGFIIICLLFVLLIIALYIYFERFFAVKAASKVDVNFMNQIKDYVSEGKLDAATDLCKNTDSPTARLVGKGISRIGKPLEDIDKAIENSGKLEIYQLEKNVSVLATISGAAPMIGFLGTVIGMIVAIHEIA